MTEATTLEIPEGAQNPVEPFLRMDRMPHIWCPGCGIGTTVNCFTRALIDSKANLDKVAIVSGIGCTGRVAGYARLDSFHTTHGRAIPFATGMKLANPELQVVVYSGDGDLFRHRRQPFHPRRPPQHGYQGDLREQHDLRHDRGTIVLHHPRPCHQRHLALWRLRADLQPGGPGRSRRRILRGALDHLSRQAAQPFHGRGAQKEGFCFIEVLSPCPTLYQRRNKMGDGLDAMKYYKQASKIRNGAPTGECTLSKSGEIVVGKFVDRDRPDYLDLLRAQMTESLGERYVEPEASCSC